MTGGDKRGILFVVNTMGLAGAECALIALLQDIDKQRFQVDLFSLVPIGEVFASVPEGVRVLNTHPNDASVLAKAGRRRIALQVLRSMLNLPALAHFVWTLPRNFRWQWRHRKQTSGMQMDKLCWELLADAAPRFDQTYDLAVAYLEGGATYYVAKHVKAKKKAAFVHVDYKQAGYLPSQDAPYYRIYDAVFGVSRDVVDTVLEAHPFLAPRAHVFHNRVNIAQIRKRVLEGKGFADGYTGLRLLTIARLHPQKALNIAVGAMALLHGMGLETRWYVLGEGPERASLQKLIAQNGLESSFVLLGSTNNPYPFIAQCDIYVQASHYEGWGIAITEAMALGKPVLATACAGPCEQITSGENGVLISLPVQARQLAEAIYQLAQDEKLREKITRALEQTGPRWEKELEALYTLTNGGDLPPDRREPIG